MTATDSPRLGRFAEQIARAVSMQRCRFGSPVKRIEVREPFDVFGGCGAFARVLAQHDHVAIRSRRLNRSSNERCEPARLSSRYSSLRCRPS